MKASLRNTSFIHCICVGMSATTSPQVQYAELLQGGVVITFSDGKSALFPAELLYTSLPQAKRLPEDTDEDHDS
jgi:hypothetical protein